MTVADASSLVVGDAVSVGSRRYTVESKTGNDLTLGRSSQSPIVAQQFAETSILNEFDGTTKFHEDGKSVRVENSSSWQSSGFFKISYSSFLTTEFGVTYSKSNGVDDWYYESLNNGVMYGVGRALRATISSVSGKDVRVNSSSVQYWTLQSKDNKLYYVKDGNIESVKLTNIDKYDYYGNSSYVILMQDIEH